LQIEINVKRWIAFDFSDLAGVAGSRTGWGAGPTAGSKAAVVADRVGSRGWFLPGRTQPYTRSHPASITGAARQRWQRATISQLIHTMPSSCWWKWRYYANNSGQPRSLASVTCWAGVSADWADCHLWVSNSAWFSSRGL